MTDVRLTALNPEDSKVYPVACNSSGELLTDKTDVGPDISIEGTLDVGGSITAANYIDSGADTGTGLIRIRKDNPAQNAFSVYEGNYNYKFAIDGSGTTKIGGTLTASPNITLNADGSAEFKGGLTSNDTNIIQRRGTNSGTISQIRFLTSTGNENRGGAVGNDPDLNMTILTGQTALNSTSGAAMGVNSSGKFFIAPYGDLGTDPKVAIDGKDGSVEFKGDVYAEKQFRTKNGYGAADSAVLGVVVQGADGTANASIGYDGTAEFAGDLVVGSRSKSWMLVEQGGLCHMVEQTRSLIDEGFAVDDADADADAADYPKLRDVFNELDLIEKSLSQVMEKLRLTPPAGWPVWDGSDESR